MENGNGLNLKAAFFVLTNKCDSYCISCSYYRHKSEVYLDISTIRKILRHLRNNGVSTIFLTGGEPALHPDFVEIVKTIKEYGFILIVCTNGHYIINIFDQIKNYIDSYSISFDGNTPELYKSIRGVDFFPSVLKLIDMVKNYNQGIQVWLACLIQKKNHCYLSEIVKTVYKLNADGINFAVPEVSSMSFGWQSDRPESVLSGLLLTTEEIKVLENEIDRIFEIVNLERIPKLAQPKEVFNDYLTYFRNFVSPVELKPKLCRFPFHATIIDENGHLQPCFYLPETFSFDYDEDPFKSREINEFLKNFESNSKASQNNCHRCFQFNGF